MMKITGTTEQEITGLERKWSNEPGTPVPFTLRIVYRTFESMEEAMSQVDNYNDGSTWTVEPDNRSNFKTLGAATGWIKKAIKRTQGWPSKIFIVYVDTIPHFERLDITVRN